VAFQMMGQATDAQDVLQEVYIKLWKQREELAQIENLEAWSIRMTRNYCIDRLRSRKRMPGQIPEHFDAPSASPSPHETAANADLLALLRRQMRTLPEQQRLVLELRDLQQMSYQEIADALAMTMSQVKINLFRARQKMRIALERSSSYGLSKD